MHTHATKYQYVRMCMRAYIRTYVYMHAYVRACMRAHCTHCSAHTLLGDSPAWFFAGKRHTLPVGVEGGQYPGEVTGTRQEERERSWN